MKKALTGISIVMLVCGLFAGLLYIIYCQFLSGDAAGDYEIPGAGATASPVEVQLSSEMNPVAFNVKGRFGGGLGIRIGGGKSRTERRSSFDARLSKDGREIWSKRFTISSKSSSGSSTSALKVFDVAEDGEYEFTVRKSSGSSAFGLNVNSMTLYVRRNVTPIDWRVAGPGLGAMALGIVGIILSAPKRKRSGALIPPEEISAPPASGAGGTGGVETGGGG